MNEKLPPRHATNVPPGLAVALADVRALDRDLTALLARVAQLTHASDPVAAAFDLDAWLALGNKRAA